LLPDRTAGEEGSAAGIEAFVFGASVTGSG
jgi:hypothetical protein